MTAVATKSKVLVALSGGVDSSVCVHLLKKQGYDVTAAVLNMSNCHADTVAAAQDAARALDVPLHVMDMREQFEREVIRYFVKSYQNGETPNPCIVCNPTVKFHAMLTLANELSCEHIATGHYAGLVQGAYTKLMRGKCHNRDQSYMLYRLGQPVLSRLMLPLADLEKPEVRSIAGELGLSCADKPDSQENCFVPDNDYAGFIERYAGPSLPGEFIAPDGTPCGKHSGIIHYTVGQRKGLGIALGRPVFIKAIDPRENRIYLADKGDDFMPSATIHDICTVSGRAFDSKFIATAKIRSTAIPVPATIKVNADGSALVEFHEPQRAVAKGQSLVLYDGDEVLGGGFIK